MNPLRELLHARQSLLQHTDIGPIGATVHAPVYYLVAYRHRETIQREATQE